MMRRFGTRWFTAAAGVAAVLLAAGCLSLTNHSRSCRSSGGVLSSGEFSCSGTAGTVQGEGPLSFDGEDDSDPDYRMDLTASVESGRMDIYADTVDGGREGGEVSPGNPIRIEAALNGGTPKDRNPHVPRTVDEIVESALACLEAGAAIVHNHNDEPNV